MQCRTPPDPVPFIDIPITPPINPANYYYECDGSPLTATPPMVLVSSGSFSLTFSGGQLHFKTNGSGYYGAYWNLLSPNPAAVTDITAEMLITRHEATYNTTQNSWWWISFGAPLYIAIYLEKHWRKGISAPYVFEQLAWLSIYGVLKWTGAYSDHVIFEAKKNLITNKWDIYYNGALIYTTTVATTITRTQFQLVGQQPNLFIDMDYLRAWKNISRE